MGLGFGWQREGRGKMEARVAVDPPATGSGSTGSSDGDAMGANLTPDTCDDGGALAPSPLDLHPTSVWLCGLCGAAGYRELTRVVRFSWAGSRRGLCMFAAWWTQWVRVVARATCIQSSRHPSHGPAVEISLRSSPSLLPLELEGTKNFLIDSTPRLQGCGSLCWTASPPFLLTSSSHGAWRCTHRKRD